MKCVVISLKTVFEMNEMEKHVDIFINLNTRNIQVEKYFSAHFLQMLYVLNWLTLL